MYRFSNAPQSSVASNLLEQAGFQQCRGQFSVINTDGSHVVDTGSCKFIFIILIKKTAQN